MREKRAYQELCIQSVLQDIGAGIRELYYQLPTGGGKTYVASRILGWRGVAVQGRILFIAHRKELIWQTAEAFRLDLPERSVGICMGTENDSHADIIVGSIQTLSRGRLEKILSQGPLSLVLIDEAHHATAKNAYGTLARTIRAACPECPLVGCTATPYRADKESMQAVLPHCSFMRTIENLQTEGYLAPTVWRPIHVDADWSQIKSSSLDGEKDYDQGELAEALMPSLSQIVEKSKPILGARPFVAFAPTVKLAQSLSEQYQAAGMQVLAIWGEMPKDQRAEVLISWKAGQTQGVVNVGILTEGFDYPNLAAIVLARPTQSPGLYLQMVGRVTRLKTGQWADALILDVAGNANLLETKQIVLPKIVDAFSNEQEQVMAEPALMDSYEPIEPAASEERVSARSYKILDPLSKSWASWLRRGDYYVASLGTDAIAVLKLEADRGLWQGVILTPAEEQWDEKARVKRVIRWHRKRVTAQAKPIRDMMGHLNQVIAANGRKHLVEKKAAWRNDAPSIAQLVYLKKLSNEEALLADRFGWTKGEVALSITYAQVAPVLAKL